MQRYFSKELNDNIFILNPDDYYHITTVMRMNHQDKIEVVYHKKLYLCFLEKHDKNVVVKIEKELQCNEDIQKEIILVIPLLKENKMDYFLQKATELEVSKIIPMAMERCIVKLEKDKESKRIERWARICKEASEQSMRVTIPVVTGVKDWQDIILLDGVKFVCSTKEKVNNIKLFLQSHQSYDRMVIVIGPEGGLTFTEEEWLNKNGFASITLGNRIMRVETVPLFILSVINYEYME